MATVVPGPFDKLPAAMSQLVGMISEFAEDKNEKTDAALLASTPPADLAKIIPQFKSQKIRNAAVSALFQDRPKEVYQQQGGKLVKTGTISGTAEVMKPDPMEALVVKDMLVGERQQAHDIRMAERGEAHDTNMMDRMLAISGLKADQKTPNEIELAGKAARVGTPKEQPGDKDAQSTMKTLSDYRAQAAGAKAAETTKAQQSSIDPASVKFYGDQILAGNPMSMGFGVPMRNAVGKYVQDKMGQMGETPDAIATKTNVRKSLSSSLTNQEKQIGMMGGFVRNIDKQVDRVGEIEKDLISRVGVRALDWPIREFRTKAIGSGHEKVLEAYTTEISNEIGKLSTGSSASVRELSTEAQERWAKIHDPNLSFTELKKILEETKHMANMRISSSHEERDATREQLQEIGAKGQKATAGAGDYQYAEGPGGTKLRWKPGMTEWEAAP